MATDKYVYNNSGVITEKAGAVTSTANAIVALDALGKLNLNMMPAGVGAEVIAAVTTSESLAAGDFVNLYNSSGLKVRKADASTTGKEANGFVIAVATHPTTADVYILGGAQNAQKTGMTIGARQYLSDSVPGGTVEAAPSGAGKIVQFLGKANSATSMATEAHDYIVLVA